MSELTLRQLEYLDAIASAGSLAEAAMRCNVSQSAVSVALAQLERQLGATLVIRGPGRPTALTAQGRATAEHARQVLASARRLVDDAMPSEGALRGRLRVGVYRTLSPYVVPDVLATFAQHHPAVEIDVVEASGPAVLDALQAGRIDVGFLSQAQVSGDVAAEVVRDARRRLVMSAEHPLARIRGSLLDRLDEHPAILLDEDPSLARTLDAFQAAGVSPRVAFRSGNVQTILNVVGRNIAWSVLLQPTSQSPEGRPLVIRELEHEGFRNPFVAVTPKGVIRSRTVDEAIAAVRRGTASDSVRRDAEVPAPGG